jgi:hypothetical protein
MFEALISLTQIFIDAIKSGINIRGKQKRTQVLLAFLTAYYSLKNLVSDGKELLALIGSSPVEKIKNMPREDQEAYLNTCRNYIESQFMRLKVLSKSILQKKAILDLLEPKLREKLDYLFSDKTRVLRKAWREMETYLYQPDIHSDVLSANEMDEEYDMYGQAEIYYRIYPIKSFPKIDVKLAIRNLEDLGKACEKLRKMITRICEPNEMIILSEKAERRAHIGSVRG